MLALVVGFPQWMMAVSTPYWDEVASSAINLTAADQFAEGVFPPRHNAFPDLPKYHYGATMLAGSVIWLTGLSANVSVDVVSTALHLFVFLFVFYWLQQIGFRRLACLWGSFTVLLGGGLAWLYVPWLHTYDGFPKHGIPSLLRHHYDAGRGWWNNLLDAAGIAAFHLQNADGSNSNLPWDVVNQFQQHAVALGLALTLLSAGSSAPGSDGTASPPSTLGGEHRHLRIALPRARRLRGRCLRDRGPRPRWPLALPPQPGTLSGERGFHRRCHGAGLLLLGVCSHAVRATALISRP